MSEGNVAAEQLRLLTEAASALEKAEATYRYCHDVLGGGDIKTGRAWDKMRRAGDRVRSLIKQTHEPIMDTVTI